MAFNHLNVPDHWQHFYSKYPQGMTILESLLEWVSQVDDMTDAVNATLAEVLTFKDSMMPAALNDILTEWELSGKLSTVLTNALLTGKANVADLDALQLVVDELSDTVNDSLSNISATVTAKLTRLIVPATDYLSNLEIADILKDNPLLNHTVAIQAYVDAQRAAGSNNLYFPKGNYRAKNVNLYDTPWNFYGMPSGGGYIHDTSFLIPADLNAVAFVSTARFMTFSDLGIVSEGSRTDAKNITFYKNTLVDGQAINARNIFGVNVSGALFDGLDLINCTFENIVTEYCNKVVKGRLASWTRHTTVTLRKIYSQYGDKPIDIPNCEQSMMEDCIFEYCASPGDISRGQWVLTNNYFENNTAGLNATNSRLIKMYNYFNTAADAILNTQTGLNYLKWGESEVYEGGAHFSRFSKHYEVAGNLSENNTGTAAWNHLGVWYAAGGGTRLIIEFLGAAGFSQVSGGSGLNGNTGKTTLMATFTGNGNTSLPSLTAYAYHEGSSKPVAKIKLVATDQYYTSFNIFVQMAAYTSKVSFKLETSAGYFRKDVRVGVADPGAASQNLVDVPFEYRIQTGTGSFKMTDDGGIELTKPVIGGGAAPATINNYTYLAINGTYYKIPLYL